MQTSTPIMTFTDAAITHIKNYIKQKNATALRISLKKTGCSGLSYVVEEVSSPMQGDVLISISEDCIVYIDCAWIQYLKGIEVDYVKSGLDAKLVFNNPNQKGQCGCGESFTVADV